MKNGGKNLFLNKGLMIPFLYEKTNKDGIDSSSKPFRIKEKPTVFVIK